MTKRTCSKNYFIINLCHINHGALVSINFMNDTYNGSLNYFSLFFYKIKTLFKI